MDAPLLIAALAGALAGLVASAFPGLHVNGLALACLALAPGAGEPGSAFLVGALAASPFGLALGATYLGAATDEDALASLPALALAAEGRPVEAVARQAWGALAGTLLAVPLALALAPLLPRAAPRLAAAMPWILLAIVATLALTERRRIPAHPSWIAVPWPHGARLVRGAWRGGRIGWRRVQDPHGLLAGAEEGARVQVHVELHWDEGPLSRAAGMLAALAVLLASGALGLAAFRLGAASPFGWPASALLPLLAGLFAMPELAATLGARARRPRSAWRAPDVPARELARAAAPGAAVSSLLGLVPGVSASHATLLAPRARTPEESLVRLAAVNGGAVVFTLLAWDALAKARSGALVAAQQYARPMPFPAAAALALAAALLACVVARALSRPLARVVRRVSPGAAAACGLAILVASVAAFNGALGLAVLGVAELVGTLPRRWGVRRSHAMGCILVPALLRAWGLA